MHCKPSWCELTDLYVSFFNLNRLPFRFHLSKRDKRKQMRAGNINKKRLQKEDSSRGKRREQPESSLT